MKGYIGTYNSEHGKGIYSFDFDKRTGGLSHPEQLFPIDGGKCVTTIDEENLLITMENPESAGVAVYNIPNQKVVCEALYENSTPCFVDYVDGMVYTANYHDGVAMVYEYINGKLIARKSIEVAPKAGCHQVIQHGRYILVPCLLIDELRIYDGFRDYILVKTISFPKGTGPRHGVFNKAHNKLYLVSELSNELFVYDVDGLEFTEVQKIPLFLNADTEDISSAAIRLNNTEDKLYISSRGIDIITVFDLDNKARLLQQISCGGQHPRDFILSKDNAYLLVVNKDSCNVLTWLLDKTSGKLLSIVSEIEMPKGIGIVLE